MLKILKCLGAKVPYLKLAKCVAKVRPGKVIDMVIEVLLCAGKTFPYDKIKVCVDKYGDSTIL